MAQLNAQWIVGFVDGEGCFNLDVHIKTDMRWGLQMQPEFTVVQHERDVNLLHDLKAYFGCGSVGINRKDSTSTRYHYRVKSVQQLVEHIIPFFEQHGLKTKKNVEFKRFRKICQLMHNGYHLQSLSNFLVVYELGENLRIRSLTKRGNKGEKVQEVVKTLKDRLKIDATLK
jgi:hypothetical protein